MGEDKPVRLDISKTARTTTAKLSDDERRNVQRLVQKAINDRDLPKFQEGLTKLGYVETSAEYEKLMRLWGEHWKASHPD